MPCAVVCTLIVYEYNNYSKTQLFSVLVIINFVVGNFRHVEPDDETYSVSDRSS